MFVYGRGVTFFHNIFRWKVCTPAEEPALGKAGKWFLDNIYSFGMALPLACFPCLEV